MMAAIDGDRIDKATDALLSITYNDPDVSWVEGVLIEHLDKRFDVQIRSLAITCLGHLARIHGALNTREVIPRLGALVQDPVLGGIAEDALADVAHYVPLESPGNGSGSV
jgi:hypothetical protein